MSEEKQMVLSSIIFIVRNILIFILVFIFFFSKFLLVLPALAIVGTAMGFALRDVISAFIAWFIIGMKDTTYKLGDIIEIPSEEIFGRVIKIHPLVTVVQELGLSGPNSKVRTFSNKLIFSASINNLSKNHGWVYIPVECMLTYESNITLAKEILLRTMNEILSQDNISHLDTMKAKLKRSGIPEDKLYPMVFTDVRMQGIFLRGKMLIKWEDRHEVRNRVSELFIQEIQKTQEVELRYIDSWVSEVQ